MTNPSSGTASATAARADPMPRATQASRSIAAAFLPFFFRVRLGATAAERHRSRGERGQDGLRGRNHHDGPATLAPRSAPGQVVVDLERLLAELARKRDHHRSPFYPSRA